MKITRHNTNESYNTTVDWLKNFADKLKKDASFIQNFKKIKVNDFSTIDEKMADIKQRVGFDIRKSTEFSPENVKSASEVVCEFCKKDESTANMEKCKKCTLKEKLPEDVVGKTKAFIQYAIDYMNHNEGSTVESCLHACRQDPSLGYSYIEKYIDLDKLKETLKKRRKAKTNDAREVKYIANDQSSSSSHLREDDMADYFRHAIT